MLSVAQVWILRSRSSSLRSGVNWGSANGFGDTASVTYKDQATTAKRWNNATPPWQILHDRVFAFPWSVFWRAIDVGLSFWAEEIFVSTQVLPVKLHAQSSVAPLHPTMSWIDMNESRWEISNYDTFLPLGTKVSPRPIKINRNNANSLNGHTASRNIFDTGLETRIQAVVWSKFSKIPSTKRHLHRLSISLRWM